MGSEMCIRDRSGGGDGRIRRRVRLLPREADHRHVGVGVVSGLTQHGGGGENLHLTRFLHRHVDASRGQSREEPLADERDLQNDVAYASSSPSTRTVEVVQHQLLGNDLLHDLPQQVEGGEENGAVQLPLTQNGSQTQHDLPDLLRAEVAGQRVEEVDVEVEVAQTEGLEGEGVAAEEEGAVAEEAEIWSEDLRLVFPQNELEDDEQVVAKRYLRESGGEGLRRGSGVTRRGRRGSEE